VAALLVKNKIFCSKMLTTNCLIKIAKVKHFSLK